MFDTISLDGEDEQSDCRHLHKYLYARTLFEKYSVEVTTKNCYKKTYSP